MIKGYIELVKVNDSLERENDLLIKLNTRLARMIVEILKEENK